MPSAGLGDMWEYQARFGYRNGIAMALHMPEGKHFFFAVDRDKPVPPDTGELTRIVADLQLFAVHAQEAAMRILTPAASAAGAPSAHAARARDAALDDGRQDGVGGRQPARHQRANRGASRQRRDAQARLRQQAPGGAEGVAARPDSLKANAAAMAVIYCPL